MWRGLAFETAATAARRVQAIAIGAAVACNRLAVRMDQRQKERERAADPH